MIVGYRMEGEGETVKIVEQFWAIIVFSIKFELIFPKSCVYTGRFLIKIILIMKSHIFTYLLALILLSCPAHQVHNSGSGHDYSSDTVITFIVTEDQPEKPEFIRIGLNLKTKDTSLVEGMEAAKESIQDIKDITLKYCEEHFVKVDCSQIAEVGEPQIEAQYQAIQEDQRFAEFVITNEITLKVYSTQKIGQFTDDLHAHGAEITQFEWDSQTAEPGEQELIEMGRERAEHACQHLGMKLYKIASVKIVDGTEDIEIEEDEDEEEEEQDQEEEQEAEFHHPDSLKFKFKIYCEPAEGDQEDNEKDDGQNDDEDEDNGDNGDNDEDEDKDQEDQDEDEEDEEQQEEEEKKKSKKKEKEEKKKKNEDKEKGKKKKEKKNKEEKKQKNKKRQSEE